MRAVRRGGEYLRVADPAWDDPLDGRFAQRRGGRWNAPGSFPVVYLSRSAAVARANVARLLTGQPYGPEDLRAEAGPILVTTSVSEDLYVDVVTGAGCAAAGLPTTYPRDPGGEIIPHEACQPIGRAAWDSGAPGIACRSAAPAAPAGSEELAWFQRQARLRPLAVSSFEGWFWRRN